MADKNSWHEAAVLQTSFKFERNQIIIDKSPRFTVPLPLLMPRDKTSLKKET